MTREELTAAIGVVLDAEPSEPDRLDTIMLAVDMYAAAEVSGGYDRGHEDGFTEASDMAREGKIP